MRRLVFLTLVLASFTAYAEPDPVGAAPPSNPTSSETLLLPGVASTLGTHATRWRSDLVLKNPGTEPIEVRVFFLRSGTSNDLANAPKKDFFLAAGDTKEIKNVLSAELGLNGTGALLATTSRSIFPDNPANASVSGWVRTAAAILYGSGDIGGAIPSAELVDTPRQVVYGLKHDGVGEKGVRAAVGVVNPASGRGVTVRVDYLDEAGESAGSQEIFVPPLSCQQVPVTVHPTGTVRFTRTEGSGPFVAYATMVTNATSDSTFVYGTPEAGHPASPHRLTFADLQ